MANIIKRSDKPVYFAKEDKLEFLNIISKYKTFFDTNDLSLLNLKRKKDFWLLIEKEYNEINPKTGPRTSEQLHTLYKNLKRKARNDAIREIGIIKTEQCSDSTNINQNENTDDENENNYIYLEPSTRTSECVSEIVESSTSSRSPKEYLIEPVITIESLQNTVTTNYNRLNTNCENKTQNEVVSSTKRVCEEEYKLKMKILKTELEAKKKEANINYEICLLRKEIEWKTKETVTLTKQAKLEEIQETKNLLKLQQENELLKNKLLRIELEKAEHSLNNCKKIMTDVQVQTSDDK